MTRRAEALSHLIQDLLVGQGSAVQGAVLADLVSMFIAGHHPALREEAIADWINLMRELIPASEQQIFSRGKPPGWEKQ